MRPGDGGVYMYTTVIDKKRAGNIKSSDLNVIMIVLHTTTINLRDIFVPQRCEVISRFSKKGVVVAYRTKMEDEYRVWVEVEAGVLMARRTEIKRLLANFVVGYA